VPGKHPMTFMHLRGPSVWGGGKATSGTQIGAATLEGNNLDSRVERVREASGHLYLPKSPVYHDDITKSEFHLLTRGGMNHGERLERQMKQKRFCHCHLKEPLREDDDT